MRFIKKYKTLTNLQTFLKVVPKRVEKFKRPKWLRLKKNILTTQSSKFGFSRFSISKVNFKQWSKVTLNFKKGMLLKRSISALYENAISINYLKKLLNLPFFKKNTFLIFFYPLFIIDILLWKLNFTSSVYAGRQLLDSKKVYVNNSPIKKGYIVKKGDIIQFNENLTSSTFFMNKIFPEFFFYFFEIDYYLKQLIVIKDLKTITIDDFKNFNTEYTNFKPLVDYLKKV